MPIIQDGWQSGPMYNLAFFAPALKYFTNIIGYQEYCHVHHPDHDSLKCAHALFYSVPKDSINMIDTGKDGEKLYFDYKDLHEASKYNNWLDLASKGTLYFGLLLYLLKF